MKKIFFAPRANEQSAENFRTTIKDGYPYEQVESYLTSEDREALKGQDKLYIWGNVAAKKPSWNKMEKGDYVFFYQTNIFTYVGNLLYKTHNRDLARTLWGSRGKDEKNEYWEYVFMLDNLRKVNLPIEKVREIGEYKNNFVVMGFMPLNDIGLKNVEKEYGDIESFIAKYKDNDPSQDMKDKNEVGNIIDKSMNETSKYLKKIHNYISLQGYTYELKDIVNFYLSLKTKPFVILAGISGTGKTKLARLFADAIKAEKQQVAVKSDWTDSSDLLGYTDLSNRFHPTDLTEFLKHSLDHPSTAHFFILDEMNLARVEHYFSDFLSKIETRKYDNNRIITDRIFSEHEFLNEDDKNNYSHLYFPDNFYVVGTVNMDETTHPFSRKVLDRASTLEFNNINLPYKENTEEVYEIDSKGNEFLKANFIILKDAYTKDGQFFNKIITQLDDINNILKRADLQIGYRIRDEICFFMYYWKEVSDLLSENAAFDLQINQKILPRIQGSSQLINEVLIELFNYCVGADYSKDTSIEELESYLVNERNVKYKSTADKLIFMIKRLVVDGFTSFWL